MGKIAKITPEYFDEVKRSLKRTYRWTRFTKRNISDVAYRHGISFKTVMQIKNSETYEDYVDQNHAQHPPVEFSLGGEVIKLHELVFDRNNVEYHKPKSAKQAINELNYRIANEDLIK